MIYEGSCQRLDSWHRTEEHERSLLHNNGIGGARAPYIRVELVSHETVAIRIVGGIVVGVVQGIPGLKEVGEGLAGLVAAWKKALGFRSKRKHFEVQVVHKGLNATASFSPHLRFSAQQCMSHLMIEPTTMNACRMALSLCRMALRACECLFTASRLYR